MSRLEDVQPRITAYTPEGQLVRAVPLPASAPPAGSAATGTRTTRSSSSPRSASPRPSIATASKTGATDVWARLAVPVAKEGVEIRQVFFTSKDGTRVPMFVAHRKGLALDGKRPTLLTGYGGFNQAQLPAFSARAAFWIENGGVYALANLRGGGEYGEAWHHAGMLDKKQNVFDDFIAAAEWLVANKYASRDTLAISGGSNGGLLVGAAMTQRPELFKAVVCSYPLLDMVRYHQFLVARYWVPEYGSSDDAGAVRRAARLLAVPQRQEGRPLPGRAVHHRRRRHARGPAARAQDGGADAGLHRLGAGSSRAPALRHEGRTLRRPARLEADRGPDPGDAVPLLAARRRARVPSTSRRAWSWLSSWARNRARASGVSSACQSWWRRDHSMARAAKNPSGLQARTVSKVTGRSRTATSAAARGGSQDARRSRARIAAPSTRPKASAGKSPRR